MRNSAMVMAVALAVLSGCGGTGENARQILGMDRRAPDAFSVTTHAPLEVPASLAQPLPVPQPGMARPQEVSATSMARSAVNAADMSQASAPSAAEQALLQKAGPADPNVRVQVNKEAQEDADAQTGPLDWMLFWKKDTQAGVAVNANAEAERLRKNQAEGKPATEGGTPVQSDTGRLSVPEVIQ